MKVETAHSEDTRERSHVKSRSPYSARDRSVHPLEGGFEAWQRVGYPLERKAQMVGHP